MSPRLPLHVTLRLVKGVESLREPRLWRVVEPALRDGAARFGTRVVHLSVQSNHIHLLVEADDRRGLSAAMKGLAVRIARRVNARLGRRGRLFAERYHARPLRSPTEVKHALHYVLHNHRHHLAASGVTMHVDWVDPCSSAAMRGELPAPETWLLKDGWQRGGRRRRRSAVDRAGRGTARRPRRGAGRR